jgi:hypothetical protein
MSRMMMPPKIILSVRCPGATAKWMGDRRNEVSMIG